MEPKNRIIFPLDVPRISEALELIEQLKDHVGCFKIGLELMNTMISSIVVPLDPRREVQQIRKMFRMLNGNYFWDGKWGDIPATVFGAAAGIAKITPKMVNIHASAGSKAMKEAVGGSAPETMILAVTVLTSLNEDECGVIFGSSPRNMVHRLAQLAVNAGVHGIICSPQELSIFQEDAQFEGIFRVTPGVRPEWASSNDQERVMTPGEAIKAGATHLVIGRPIRKPPTEIGSPVDAAKRIAAEIAEALAV